MGVENRPTGDLNLMKAFGPSVQSPIKLILDKWKSNCQKNFPLDLATGTFTLITVSALLYF